MQLHFPDMTKKLQNLQSYSKIIIGYFKTVGKILFSIIDYRKKRIFSSFRDT